jgi:surface antigen
MNYAWVAVRFLFGGKEFKIAGAILAALILFPAFTVVLIAAAPASLIEDFFNGSNTNSGVASANPVSEGVAVLPDFRYPGNNYALGNCTYWVFARRAQVGFPIPNTLGNANTWDDRAKAQGYIVDHSPAQYEIVQTDRGSLGHVAFVEKVNTDGSFYISEMNVLGLFIVDHKTYPASAAANYNFISTAKL